MTLSTLTIRANKTETRLALAGLRRSVMALPDEVRTPLKGNRPMSRMLSAALVAATMAVVSAPHAHADGTRISITPFQSRQAWQANWDNLNQRGNDAGAQWECHGDHECNLYFIVKPGVKAHLATERYGRGYCYIVDGAPTADCYREDGKKSVWTLDKPFDYGLASQPAPTYTPTSVENHPNEGVEMPGVNGKPWSSPPPAYTSPPPAYTSPPVTSSWSVPLRNVPGIIATQTIDVDFGGGAVYAMLFDTGCSTMTVSPTLADWLIANGKATEAGTGNGQMADGSVHDNREITINSISVGGHTLYNVNAGVIAKGQNAGDMLIGIGVLQAFGKLTIDSANHQLTFS